MTKVHFLGIGGSGASAAAAIAKSQGFEVTGCDLDINNEFTSHLNGVDLSKGHNPKHLIKVDILAITPAINSLDPSNPELKAAKEKNIPVFTWQEFTGKYLLKDKFVIAVIGTHGKSTITAMIAKLLEDANLDPTVLLGAIIPKWRANYLVPTQSINGRGCFVIEADEAYDSFLNYKADIAVVTNIEMDHPEYFEDFNAYLDSFEKFLLQTKKVIIANLKDEWITELLKVIMKHSSATSIDYSKTKLNLPLKIPGEFNQLNSQAAFHVGLTLNLDPTLIKKSLAEFIGIGRRFEYLGDYKGAKVYSDFGHHPTEVKVTMEAAREKFPNQRIWLIFEPHMFTRTKALFSDFVKVFKSLPADKIIITDIYPSREKDTGLISSQQLVDAISDDRLVYHTKADLITFLNNKIQKGDILFFMGAGDIDKVARELLS